MRNYIYTEYIFRLDRINWRWICTDPLLFPGYLCDFLRKLGVDSLPDHVEFMRLRYDDGKSVWINVDPLRIKFRFNNFKFSDLCTDPLDFAR